MVIFIKSVAFKNPFSPKRDNNSLQVRHINSFQVSYLQLPRIVAFLKISVNTMLIYDGKYIFFLGGGGGGGGCVLFFIYF